MAERLPQAEWTKREDLAALVAALGPGQARYVGGAVRDTLLGQTVRDVDVATPLRPETVIERLGAAGIRSVPTGIAHGTVTAVLPQGHAEITTLRRDVSTDGRRATVAYSDDWREDATRRDFTINALYADPATREVFDWFGGLADLAARRVRFIGDARERIREDHLRILRYFRFQARFGSQPVDEEAESACRELAPTLKALSRERVGWELLALLGLPDPAPTVARMAELGVLEQVLPEATPEALAALVAAEQRQGVMPDPIRRLAALLPPEPALAEQVAARLRLSLAQKKRLTCAAERVPPPPGEGDHAKHGGGARAASETSRGLSEPPVPLHLPAGGPPPRSGEEPRALAYRLGIEEARDRLLIEGRDVRELKGWDVPRFPLKGGAIVARGVKAGPEVARTLRAVEDRWVAEGFPDEARVAELLDKALPR